MLFVIQVDFKEHLSVTASGRCSWKPIETINVITAYISKSKELNQKTIFIIALGRCIL